MFTQEEFDIMVEELLSPELSYDMLLTIVERFKAPIAAWCASDKSLRGRGYEDEIHQNFRIRVTNCCIDSFLRRDGVGTVNRDTAWFRRWLYTVAENIKRDQARAVRREDNRRGGDLTLLGEEEPLFLTVERRESLKRSFAIVLDTSVAPYKVLTWVGLSLLILENKTNKIEGNDLLLREFEEKNNQLIKLNKDDFIRPKDILFIERNKSKAIVYTKDDTFETCYSLNNIENELPDSFVRVHRSYIVNPEQITRINKDEKTIYFVDNLSCPLGQFKHTHKEDLL